MIIKYSEAKAQGLKFYYTGKFCSRRHRSNRYVHNGKCVECEEYRRLKHKSKSQLRIIRSEAEPTVKTKKQILTSKYSQCS